MAKKRKPTNPPKEPEWIIVDDGPLSDAAIDALADLLIHIAEQCGDLQEFDGKR